MIHLRNGMLWLFALCWLFACNNNNPERKKSPSKAINYNLKVYVSNPDAVRTPDGHIQPDLMELLQPIASVNGDTIYTPNDAAQGISPVLEQVGNNTIYQSISVKDLKFDPESTTNYDTAWKQNLNNTILHDQFTKVTNIDDIYASIQGIENGLAANRYAIVLTTSGNGTDSTFNMPYTDNITMLREKIKAFLLSGTEVKDIAVFWKVEPFPVDITLTENVPPPSVKDSIPSIVAKPEDGKTKTEVADKNKRPPASKKDWDENVAEVKNEVRIPAKVIKKDTTIKNN